MISFPGNLPALLIGRHHLTGYDTGWITAALERAATEAGREDFPFIADIHAGIRHYLEHRCPLAALPVEQLFDRIRGMLVRIGCPAIAATLRPAAPPMTLSLAASAKEAGNGYELLFFRLLREDLQQFAKCGVETVRIRELKNCALILQGKKKSTASCQRLEADIIGFLRQCEPGEPAVQLVEDDGFRG